MIVEGQGTGLWTRVRLPPSPHAERGLYAPFLRVDIRESNDEAEVRSTERRRRWRVRAEAGLRGGFAAGGTPAWFRYMFLRSPAAECGLLYFIL